MIAELLIGGSSLLTGGGGVWLANQLRESWGKNPHTEPPPPPTLEQVIKQGYKAVEAMQRDIKSMYHPKGCKCAMCEITADDEPPEPEPEPEPPTPAQEQTQRQAKFEAKAKRKGRIVAAVEQAVEDTNQTVYEAEKNKWATQVKNLETQLKELGEAYANLKAGDGTRVVTKTVERKTILQEQIEQCFKFADEGQEVIKLNVELQGRAIQVIVSPQRPPDSELEAWGESETIKRWHDKPASIEPMDAYFSTLSSAQFVPDPNPILWKERK